LIRLPKVEGRLDIGGSSDASAKGASVIPVLNHVDLLRIDRIAVALKAEVVCLACRISGSEKYQPVGIIATNRVIKGVMAVRTLSYIVGIQMIRVRHYG
jgi:hypothetical protein